MNDKFRRVFLFSAFLISSLILGFVLAPVALADHVGLLIDHFDTSPPQEIVTQSSATSSVEDLTGVIGGYRNLYLERTGGSGDVKIEINRDASSQLFFNAESGNALGIVRWDGDNDATTDSFLLNADLTGNNQYTGVFLGVKFLDVPTNIVLTMYTGDGTNSSEYALNNLASLWFGQDFYLPFSDFNVTGGSGADFADVDAITLRLENPLIEGIDLRLEFIEVYAKDWGDLPDSYGTVATSNGPSHILNNLYLGAVIDGETDGFDSIGDGDDTSNDADEEGVSPVAGNLWLPGNTVPVEVTVTNDDSTTGGYLFGWFDWNNNGTFEAGEIVDFGLVPEGTSNLPVTVGTGYSTGNTLNVRFRLYPTVPAIPSPFGEVVGGEVEDHQWEFYPTAVTLSSLSARSALSTAMIAAVVAAGLLVLVAVYAAFIVRRRRAG